MKTNINKNTVLAIGNKVIAGRLLRLVKKYRKKYKINISEAIELTMRNPRIWKGYEYLI